MNKKFHCYNFSDSRRLSSEDVKLERLAQRMGIVGESSVLPMASQSARTTTQPDISSGKGRKKCQKGDSCGAACIYHGDKCLKKFPKDVTESLDTITDLLGKYNVSEDDAIAFLGRLATKAKKDDEGEEGEEDGEEVAFPKSRVKEFLSSLEELKKSCYENGVFNEEKYEKTLEYIVPLSVQASLTEREKKAPSSPEELEAIEKRKKILEEYDKVYKEAERRKEAGNPFTPEELRERVLPLAQQRRVDVSPEAVNLFVSMLPESERNYLRQAGALEKSPNGGRFEDGAGVDSLPSNYGPLAKQGGKYADNRMKVLAGIYLAEGGRDFASGMRIPLTHSDLEHNIPAEIGGKASDQPANMSFFRSGNNMGRGSKLYMDWWNSKVKREGLDFDGQGNLTPESKSKAQERFEKVWSQINLKNEIEGRAARAQNAATLRELYQQVKQEDDPILQRKLFAKIIAFSMGVSETVGGGVQSHGRADKRWYWLGKDTNKSEQVSTRMIEKLLDLYEKNDKEGLSRFREILNSASERVKEEVARRVSPDPKDIDPDTGKPFVRVVGERGKEVRAIVTEVRDQVLKEVLNL